MTRETVLMNNTIITYVVVNASFVGLEINTVISCLDDYVKGFTPTPNILTLQTSHLQTLNSINDVNDNLTHYSLN